MLLAIANKMLTEVMPDLSLRDDVQHAINVSMRTKPMFQTRHHPNTAAASQLQSIESRRQATSPHDFILVGANLFSPSVTTRANYLM